MKPAAATLAELVSAEVGGGASKSQAGTPSIVLGEEARRLMKEWAISSDVVKKTWSCVYSYTGVHMGSACDGKRVYEEPTFSKPVYPPGLAPCPGAPVCIALGGVLSLDVSLHHVLIKRHSGPSCPLTSPGS